MSTKIEGMPDGYELVRIGWPKKDELFLRGSFCTPVKAETDLISNVKPFVVVKKTLTLEYGKKYVARNGQVFGPLELSTHQPGFPFLANGRYWSVSGVRYWEEDRDNEDLVAEYVKPTPVYRAFANAAEFATHRDKWIRRVAGGGCFAVSVYSDMGIVYGADGKSKSYQELLSFKFEDGTTCGVLVTEGSAK